MASAVDSRALVKDILRHGPHGNPPDRYDWNNHRGVQPGITAKVPACESS